MKLGDFLNSLAVKAGVNPADKALVDFLSRQDIANIDLSQELTSAIDANLMTIDGAKNNPTVKSHFNALALNGIDSEILNALPELGFGDDVLTEFKNEKNTNSKLRNLVAKMKDAKKNFKDADPADKKKYADEILGLNQQITQIKEGHTTELNNLKKQHLNEITDLQVNTLLAGKPYANKDLPSEVNSTVARTLLNSSLQSRGAKLVNVNGKLLLKRADDESLDYMDNHKPVTLESFIDSVLAENKLLAVNNNNQQTPSSQTKIESKTPQGSNFGQQLNQLNETINQFEQ